MSEGQLTIIFTERGLLLSSEHWDDWRSVQSSFADYKASLHSHTAESVFDYLAHDYSVHDLPFDRELVDTFVSSDHGRTLWARGSVPSDDNSPSSLQVRDVFDITGQGVVLGCDRDLPIDTPLGDHQVTVGPPGGRAEPRLVRAQLVHFNPSGHRVILGAPYSTDTKGWIGTSLQF